MVGFVGLCGLFVMIVFVFVKFFVVVFWFGLLRWFVGFRWLWINGVLRNYKIV